MAATTFVEQVKSVTTVSVSCLANEVLSTVVADVSTKPATEITADNAGKFAPRVKFVRLVAVN